MIPILYSGKFKDIEYSKYDEIWLIVRSLKNKSIIKDHKNVFWVPELSPTPELFNWYLNQRKKSWSIVEFEDTYVPWFLKDISQNVSAAHKLNELYYKSKTKNILIVCFCQNVQLCHRKIISNLIAQAGGNSMLTVGNEYYNMYKKFKKEG